MMEIRTSEITYQAGCTKYMRFAAAATIIPRLVVSMAFVAPAAGT